MSLEIKVNLSQEGSPFKVVQIKANGVEHILMATISSGTNHAEILGDFLNAQGLNFEYKKYSGEKGKKKSLPSLEGGHYKVLGMGQAITYPKEKEATFCSSSFDYNLPIDPSQIERLKEQYPDWNIEFIEEL